MSGPTNPSMLTWDCPQTNTDGSVLANLASFTVSVSPQPTGPWTDVATVMAPNPNPSTGETAFSQVSSWGALPNGQLYATVRACNLDGICSEEAVSIPFVEQAASPPSQVTNLRFS